MHITYTKNNAEQALMADGYSSGVMTVQEGTETTEIYKTHFLSLGEIVKIHKIEGNEERASEAHPWFSFRIELPFSYLPISECTLDISIWKIIALAVAVLPVLFIRSLCYGSAPAILTRDVKVERVQIEATRDYYTGNVSLETKKRPVILLNEAS